MSWNIDNIDKQPVNKFVLNGTVYLFKSYLSFLIKNLPGFYWGSRCQSVFIRTIFPGFIFKKCEETNLPIDCLSYPWTLSLFTGKIRIEQSIYVWGNKLLIKGKLYHIKHTQIRVRCCNKKQGHWSYTENTNKKHHNYKTVIILKESLTFEKEQSYRYINALKPAYNYM